MISSTEFCCSCAVNHNGQQWSHSYKGQKCPLENLRLACPHQTHSLTHPLRIQQEVMGEQNLVQSFVHPLPVFTSIFCLAV